MANDLLKTLTIDNISMDVQNLTAGDYIDFQGGVHLDTSNFSLSGTAVLQNNEAYDLDAYNVPGNGAGLYIFSCTVIFPSNATGVRYMNLFKYINESQTTGGLIAQQRLSASPNGQTHLSAAFATECAPNDIIKLRLFQNAVAEMTVSWQMGGIVFYKDI